MQKPRIIRFETLDEVALIALDWLSEKTSEQGKDMVSIALSGGNTPQVLFEKLVKLDSKTVDWNKILFFWGDERCVPPDHFDSNYRTANANLLQPLNIPSEHIFRIHGEDNAEIEAERYGKLLKEYLPIVDGFPQFDLMMLGLGEDGHTASIFPSNNSLFQAHANCAIAVHPQNGQKRITLTGSVINHAAQVAFLVTGNTKSAIVAQVIETPDTVDYPAALVAPFSGKLTWLLDKAAASELK